MNGIAFDRRTPGLTFPVVTRRMLNTYIPDRNIRMTVLAAVFVLVMYGIRAFLQCFCPVLQAYDGHPDPGPDAALYRLQFRDQDPENPEALSINLG